MAEGNDDVTETVKEKIKKFLTGSSYAVVGASRDRAKYGNKVLRAYLQRVGLQPDLEVFAVNPGASEVEGQTAYPDLTSLPEAVDGVSVITPPEITEGVVEEAVRLGIEHIWLQPGAESRRALELAEEAGMNAIAGGPCVLVALGYHE